MGSIDPTKRLQKGFRDVFSLDLRSLAAFRVALALVLLYDLADRSRDLAAHYTEQGVFPVAQALEEFGDKSNAEISQILGTSRRVLELRLSEFGLEKARQQKPK